MSVVEFPVRQTAQSPHMAGLARCMQCSREWVAVAEVGTVGLECPSCHTNKGVFVNPASRPDELHYRCRCGSEMFCITPQRVYCPHCGLDHRPFDTPHGVMG